MKNYHVRCESCGETLSVYAKTIFDALEDVEHNHFCEASVIAEKKIDVFRNSEGQIETIMIHGEKNPCLINS